MTTLHHGGKRRVCGNCGMELTGKDYAAFAVCEEPELNAGRKVRYRFCAKCWAGIEAALEQEGVEQVEGVRT